MYMHSYVYMQCTIDCCIMYHNFTYIHPPSLFANMHTTMTLYVNPPSTNLLNETCVHVHFYQPHCKLQFYTFKITGGEYLGVLW